MSWGKVTGLEGLKQGISVIPDVFSMDALLRGLLMDQMCSFPVQNHGYFKRFFAATRIKHKNNLTLLASVTDMRIFVHWIFI